MCRTPQHRRTPRGLSYTAGRVQGLRHYWDIPRHQPDSDPQQGDLLTVADAARELGLAPSTLHRWLTDGFIGGEQLTPGAPWRIPPHPRHPRPVHRRPRRLARHAGGHPHLRRLPSDHHATCQARRTPRRPPAHRTQERPAYRTPSPPDRAVLITTMNRRSSVSMHPRTPGYPYQRPSRSPSTSAAPPPAAPNGPGRYP